MAINVNDDDFTCGLFTIIPFNVTLSNISILINYFVNVIKTDAVKTTNMEAGTVKRRVVLLQPAHAALVAPICGTRGTGLQPLARNTQHRSCGTRSTSHAAHTQNCSTSFQTGAAALSFLLSPLPYTC